MAFLGANELRTLLPTCIDRDTYNPLRIKQAAYELCLGNEVFRTDSENRKPEILDDKNQTVEINAGQFALLLTQEKITVPKDKIAFISIKAGEKLKGLVNVSGFHVDPGFSGNLLFSVYNAGPSTITLKKGKEYFLIWFGELKSNLSDTDAYNNIGNEHQNQSEIPTKYIDALKRGELASPNILLERIKTNENSLRNNWWLLTIIVGLFITICIKYFNDYSKFNDGFKAGREAKEANEQVQQVINKIHLDSIINYSVDSILKVKYAKIDTGKTK